MRGDSCSRGHTTGRGDGAALSRYFQVLLRTSPLSHHGLAYVVTYDLTCELICASAYLPTYPYSPNQLIINSSTHPPTHPPMRTFQEASSFWTGSTRHRFGQRRQWETGRTTAEDTQIAYLTLISRHPGWRPRAMEPAPPCGGVHTAAHRRKRTPADGIAPVHAQHGVERTSTTCGKVGFGPLAPWHTRGLSCSRTRICYLVWYYEADSS